jgi:hypothetical protein
MKPIHSLSRRHKTTLIVNLVILVTLLLWVSLQALSSTISLIQSAEKSIQRLESYKNEPLRVIEVKAAQKTVKLGEKFTGNEDWLKDSSLTLRNVSGKPIVFIEIDLNLPETKTSGNEMSFPLKLGQRPGGYSKSPPMLLNAGDEVTFTLNAQKYEELLRFVETRHPISQITQAVISIGFVIFSDGTAWSGGTWYRRDSKDVNRYVPQD